MLKEGTKYPRTYYWLQKRVFARVVSVVETIVVRLSQQNLTYVYSWTDHQCEESLRSYIPGGTEATSK